MCLQLTLPPQVAASHTAIRSRARGFGLAQPHQLRGRVRRGSRRGTAYLLTPAGRSLPPATRRRLYAIESSSSLGAGAAIAAADLDLRGAADLFGNQQAGHVRALGTGLYQHLLGIAVAEQQGNPAPPQPPALHTGLAGRIPKLYIPEQDLRLSLYARLARFPEPAALLAFAHELEDRFGPRPRELDALIALHRLRLAYISQCVVRLDASPRGAALTLQDKIPGRTQQRGWRNHWEFRHNST